MSEVMKTGGSRVVEFLEAQGVETVFAISGAGNLAILDPFLRSKIKIVFSHHEQAAVMEAIGYSRVSGKPGVALVTTGGGTSNVITGALSAHLDSTPVMIISGNESSFQCENMRDFRAYGVQGFDSVAVLSPITKSSTRVIAMDELDAKLSSSWSTMISARKGPVHLDIPMDIQRKSFVSDMAVTELYPKPGPTATKSSITDLLSKLEASERPLFYFGQGLSRNRAVELVGQLFTSTHAPFVLSWSAMDYLEAEHPGNIGKVGIYGDRHANIALQKADLVIAIGTRLAIPQVGYDKTDFGRKAEKFVVDCDPIELSKFNLAGWQTLEADADSFLSELVGSIAVSADKKDFSSWLSEIRDIEAAVPRLEQVGPRPLNDSGFVHSVDVMAYLNEALGDDAVIATDVGAALLSGHYALQIKSGQRLFTSQGLGEMGFGLPGSLGSYFAAPERQFVCLDTDGAMMFNLQELQLVKQEKIPLKLFVFNNLGYSMIKISQDNLFDGRLIGSSPESGVTFPDFAKIADAFGMHHSRVESAAEFGTKIADALASERAEFIEIMMDPDQKYLPRLATSKAPDGSLVSPPLEDLEPKIDLGLLEKLLGYKAHANSYSARGLSYDA